MVKGIALEKESEMPLVLLQEKGGEGILPVWIGPSEASSIIVELEGVLPPRPLTHDLLALFFERHRFQLLAVELYDRRDDTYLARLRYKKGLKIYTMDLRPSDGLALAVRLQSPIFCSRLLFSPAEGRIKGERWEPFDSEMLFLKNNREL